MTSDVSLGGHNKNYGVVSGSDLARIFTLIIVYRANLGWSSDPLSAKHPSPDIIGHHSALRKVLIRILPISLASRLIAILSLRRCKANKSYEKTKLEHLSSEESFDIKTWFYILHVFEGTYLFYWQWIIYLRIWDTQRRKGEIVCIMKSKK